MKFTSYLYIFALTVLCSPRFLIKDKSPNYILYSIIFTLILYITFDFVNKYTENYEQYNVDVKGVDSLVDLIKTQGGTNDSKKIDTKIDVIGIKITINSKKFIIKGVVYHSGNYHGGHYVMGWYISNSKIYYHSDSTSKIMNIVDFKKQIKSFTS